MPNPLQPPWSQLIPLFPVADHSVTVNAAAWQPHLADHGLQNQHQAIFGGNQSVRLSRGRLQNHAYPNHMQKCLEIFMWGWPTRARGNLRASFLQNVNAIAATASQNLQWPVYYNNLHELGNLGISTITKLAYFYGHQFGGLPGVILDLRIIGVLAEGRWQALAMPGLSYNNAAQNYPAYLQAVANVAGQIGCTPAHVELLLFSWGDAF